MHVGIELLVGTVEKLKLPDESIENPIVVNPQSEPEVIDDPFDNQIGEDILKLLFDEEKISQMTDLNEKLIVSLARGEFMADRYNSPILREYMMNIKRLRISNKREGRKEASHLLSSQFDRMYGMDQTPVGLFDSLFTNKGGNN